MWYGISCPTVVETFGGDARIMGGVFGIAMTEIVLNETQIVASVGERERCPAAPGDRPCRVTLAN